MRRRGIAVVAAIAALAWTWPPAEAWGQGAREATATRVMVRAVSKDAKVIGSGVGGARIAIRNARTGEVLAEGVQEGTTGSTEAIMLSPRLRGLTAYGADPEAAGFLAILELEEPTPVEVLAEGPLGTPHAIQRASKTLLLIPGRDVMGEGVVLELNGFTVELLEPAPPEGAGPAELGPGPIQVRARVTLLCGCPTEPGGLWDSEQYEILARLLLEGRAVAETPLAYSGTRSEFVGTLPDPGPGAATLEVLAADPGRANFGMVRREVRVAR